MRRIRTFVCFGSTTREVEEGQSLVVGRSSSCDVPLDDDLASREHLTLSLTRGRFVVKDLGSRNGVLVNGLPVKGEQELHHGDTITAGRTPISVVRQAHEPRRRPESRPGRFRITSENENTETGSLYELLEGSTRMALDTGDITSAEGSGRSLLVAIRGYIARGRPVEARWLPGAVDLALRLGEASEDGVWLDRALDLHTAAQSPMNADAAKRMSELADSVRPSRGSLEGYLAMARKAGDAASVGLLEPLLAQLGE